MDRHLSLKTIAASSLWLLAVALTLAGTIVLAVTFSDEHLPLVLVLFMHAILAMGAAATMTVKVLLDGHYRMLRNAFQYGRDAASVTELGGRGLTR